MFRVLSTAALALLLSTSAFGQLASQTGLIGTVTDSNGQYRITALPIGTYTVTFSLEGFQKRQQENVILTSGFTAPIRLRPMKTAIT